MIMIDRLLIGTALINATLAYKGYYTRWECIFVWLLLAVQVITISKMRDVIELQKEIIEPTEAETLDREV